jgi:hypothetical protein
MKMKRYYIHYRTVCQDEDQKCSLVSTVMNFQVHKRQGQKLSTEGGFPVPTSGTVGYGKA